MRRRACVQGLIGSLSLACTRRRSDEETGSRTQTTTASSSPEPVGLPRLAKASALYTAGFRFGEIYWVDGRPVHIRTEPEGPLHMAKGLGIRAPTMAAIAANRAALAELDRIAVLEIDGPTCDLRPLAGLANVESVWLSCRAGDLSPLRALPDLARLRLKRTSVLFEPMAILDTLPQLRELEIHGHLGPRGPLALEWLRAFPGLEVLALSSAVSRPLTLAGLRGLPLLRELDLSGFVLDDLRPLVESPSLRKVMLERSLIRSFSGLARRGAASPRLKLELPKSSFSASDLASVALREPGLSVVVPAVDPPALPVAGSWPFPKDLEGLWSPLHEAGFRLGTRASRFFGQELFKLDVEVGPMSMGQPVDQPVIIAPDMEAVAKHLAHLAVFPRIAVLLVNGPTTDLRPLVGLDNLEGLWIYSVDADLAPLRSLPQLSRLYFRRDSVVSEPASFGALPQLRKLGMHGFVGPNSDELGLDWLRSIPNLERLDLGEGSGRTLDLTALTGLRRLREVRLHQFHIVDLSPIGGRPELELVELHNCNIEWLRGLVSFRAGRYVVRLMGSQFSERELAEIRARVPQLSIDTYEID